MAPILPPRKEELTLRIKASLLSRNRAAASARARKGREGDWWRV